MNPKAEIEKIAAMPDLLSRAMQLAGLFTRVGGDFVVIDRKWTSGCAAGIQYPG